MARRKHKVLQLIETEGLPQYHIPSLYDLYTKEFWNSDSEEIERTKGERGKHKLAESFEVDNDNLKFFVENNEKLQEEFFNELSERITPESAELFCKIISDNWIDGYTKRTSPDVINLKKSIYNYLKDNITRRKKIFVNSKIPKGSPNLDIDDIEIILQLNKEMLTGYLEQWLEGHKKYLDSTVDDIYFRRGLYLKDKFRKRVYRENDFITSYSLSFTVTEKFSQIHNDYYPVILNSNWHNLSNRVLFFSPFIRGMSPYQFELATIPALYKQKIINQGIHGSIQEFLIDDYNYVTHLKI